MICLVHRHGKSGESVFGISDNRHCRDFDLVHFGRVDIYMDNARVRGKLTDFACDAIIEAQAFHLRLGTVAHVTALLEDGLNVAGIVG